MANLFSSSARLTLCSAPSHPHGPKYRQAILSIPCSVLRAPASSSPPPSLALLQEHLSVPQCDLFFSHIPAFSPAAPSACNTALTLFFSLIPIHSSGLSLALIRSTNPSLTSKTVNSSASPSSIYFTSRHIPGT